MAEAGLWKAPSQWAAGMWPERPCGSWRKPWAPCFRTPKSQFLQSGHHRRGALWPGEPGCLAGGNVPGPGFRRSGLRRGPLLDRNIFALSGGEKQRIACASAWAMGPEVFVLDELSSNLDGEGIRQLRDILRRLKAAGKTVLVAEHRLWYAADLADRVFYLRGRAAEADLRRCGVLGFAGREAALHGPAEFERGAAARAAPVIGSGRPDGTRPSASYGAGQSGRLCPLPHHGGRLQPLPVTTGRARPLWPDACAV